MVINKDSAISGKMFKIISSGVTLGTDDRDMVIAFLIFTQNLPIGVNDEILCFHRNFNRKKFSFNAFGGI